MVSTVSAGLGIQSTTPVLTRMQELLACPTCRGDLHRDMQSLVCRSCAAVWPVVAGRPVFIPDPKSVNVVSEQHSSNQIPPDVSEWMSRVPGLILNIGAGGTVSKLPNVIELEYQIFRNTDVAADAMNLPFKDNSFDAAVSFNTFEHLADPARAAAEILRVLKPGAKLVLHTAYLQPLHEAPHHYYPTTEFGLRKWFENFRIQTVKVSPNFTPGHVLAWLATHMQYGIGNEQGVEAHREFGESTLDYWVRCWQSPETRQSGAWRYLETMSELWQRSCAAGFHLEAVKPV